MQPLDAEFGRVPEAQRKAALEFYLRKRTFLEQGSEVVLPLNSRLHTLRVTETKPASAVLITDVDVETTILPASDVSDRTWVVRVPAIVCRCVDETPFCVWLGATVRISDGVSHRYW